MLQRLGFLSCLITDPDFLVLDEPLSGLDPLGRKEFKDIIKEYHTLGKTIFFSSHILSDVEELCTEFLFLKDGAIKKQDQLNNFYEKYEPEKYEVWLKGDWEYWKGVKNDEIPKLVVSHEKLNETLLDAVNKKFKIIKVQPLNYSLENFVYGESEGNE